MKYRTLGKTEEIWYKSTFDGRDIQGWITKPPFYDPSRTYPLMVENHGGQFQIMAIGFPRKCNSMLPMDLWYFILIPGVVQATGKNLATYFTIITPVRIISMSWTE